MIRLNLSLKNKSRRCPQLRPHKQNTVAENSVIGLLPWQPKFSQNSIRNHLIERTLLLGGI
jgi:hypothetical protein